MTRPPSATRRLSRHVSRRLRISELRRPLEAASTRSDEQATIIRLPLDGKAWHEGYLAGRGNLTREANPYAIGTAEAQAWQLGLSIGRLKHLRHGGLGS